MHDPCPEPDPKDVLERIRQMTEVFAEPTFPDPRCATDEQLRYAGLPPRPDEHTQKHRYAFWMKMFTPPASGSLRFIKSSFAYEPLPLPPIVSPPRRVGDGGHESSRNWSGAYVTPRNGRVFTEVHGAWTVPTVAPPPDVPGEVEYRLSHWIGLDGQRRYRNTYMPQAGTAQRVSVKKDEVILRPPTAWWQWWMLDGWNPLPLTLPLPVAVGDEIMCSIFVLPGNRVKYLLVNHTQGVATTPFVVPDPVTILPACPHRRPVQVTGATAEWVVERPTNWVSKLMFDAPTFTNLSFQHCQAVSAPKAGEPGDDMLPAGMRMIRMYRVEDGPARTVTVSRARRLRRERFQASYLGEQAAQAAPPGKQLAAAQPMG